MKLQRRWPALAAAALLSSAVWAQYSPDATLDLGTSYGQLALGQAALSGTRAIGKSSAEASRAAKRPQAQSAPQPPIAGSMNFKSTSAVTDLVNQRFIERQSQNHPELRAQLAEEILSGDLQNYFAGILRQYGYETDNLADVTSAYYLSLWKIIHEREPTPQQIAAVQAQTREFMAQDQNLMQLPDAAKQEICETFALHTALALQGYALLVSENDTETLANFRRGLQVTLAPQGPDLASMNVTDRGFVTGK
jgi:hypothetical protein